ncbi:DUF4166 domain-containing protein [Paenibacillus sp. R14(2021)]|uniref:DUF4166 domain-containing protein n=1 Tax=Paenibacillus sp. R14(2021) TaxID=2859228 RepID=UPI001C61144C|nr:DUF4166 domain-containing protein [Paenibacillus sp. R14(2021)]
MRSIYEQVLGKQFESLHPRMQERFGFDSEAGIASIGEGVMERVWYAKWAAAPLKLGSQRHMMFPQGGANIPFTVSNYAYTDSYGRETVTWIRRFHFPDATRKFDATMIYSRERRSIVDYLGTKQHLAVDLDFIVSEQGGIRIISREQRFYAGILQFRVPAGLTGEANIHEWYDDEAACYRIEADIRNPIFGPVFQYRGTFQASVIPTAGRKTPYEVKPLREEFRE